MLETKAQKQIFYGSIALIIILLVVSIWHRPLQNSEVDYASLQQKSQQKQQAYIKFLDSLGTNPQAQKQLFAEIVSPEEMRQAVEQELNANQKIVIPDKPKTAVRVVNAIGKDTILNYAEAAGPIVEHVNLATDLAENDLLLETGDAKRVDELIISLESSLKQYSKLAIPKEAADFQFQQLIALEAYLDMAKLSRSYIAQPDVSPWPQMYKQIAIIAESTHRAESKFQALDKKYGFSGPDDSDNAAGSWLAPSAHAFFFSLVIDIFQKIQTITNTIAQTALAQFQLHFLQKLSKKIQQAYAITNYLYYTDALAGSQYVDDYLNKYVDNPLDRSLVKQFIPSVSCGKQQNLASVFKAKANVHLGFDPNSLNPKDPDYYKKLAKTGDFLSSPNGWQIYYQDVAAQANSAAQTAANQELISGGKKSSRDPTGGILTSVQDIVTTQEKSLQAMLSEGFPGESGNPLAAKISSQATQIFLNTFVFKGAVLKEQKACLPVPVVNLVTTVPTESAPDIPNPPNIPTDYPGDQ